MPIDTRRVTDRRIVTLDSLDAYRAEVRRVAEADRAGRVRRVGNWSVGQILNHLAFWIDTTFDGVPGLPAPWLVRVLGPLLKKRLLKSFPVGFRMRGVEGGTFGIEEVPADEAARRLLTAIDRLDRGTPPERHPILGRMTKAERVAMQLRHAELHLSFLRVE